MESVFFLSFSQWCYLTLFISSHQKCFHPKFLNTFSYLYVFIDFLYSNDSYMLVIASLNIFWNSPTASHDIWQIDVHEKHTKKKKKISHICILTCYFVTDYKLPLFIGNKGFTYRCEAKLRPRCEAWSKDSVQSKHPDQK